MFAQIEYPEKLLPEELDNYLAKGWFRMRQTIFTTNFLHFKNHFYSAIWLRVGLEHSIPDKKQLTLEKLNKGFRTEIKKAGDSAVTPEQEMLFQYYRESIAFDISPSLQELLFGNEPNNRFDTHEVNIYDGDIMIATGFFDMGKKSAAGITCIYHPAYKKHSLGKYLMYKKMDFCKQQQLQYFYPGYVVPGYTPFDYKLAIGKATLHYLQLSTQQWLPYSIISPALSPLEEMLEKLTYLQTYLAKNNSRVALQYYQFFEANLDPYYSGQELLDFPVFLHLFFATNYSHYLLVVFDIRDAKYHLLECRSVINISFQENYIPVFNSDLLKVEQPLLVTSNLREMADYLYRFLGNR